MADKAPVYDYYHTISSAKHGDASSGPLYFRFGAMVNNPATQELSARILYNVNDVGYKTISGEVDMSYANTGTPSQWNIDLSFDVKESLSSRLWNDLRTNKIPDGSAVHFQLLSQMDAASSIFQDSTSKIKHEVTLSKEAFYDLPEDLEVHVDPAGAVGSGLRAPGVASRFTVAPSERSVKGDVMQQSKNLHLTRNIVLDLCGGTGFPKSQTADTSWVTDISWATCAPDVLSLASKWMNAAPLDVSDNVYPGRNTSRIELGVSGEHVFDVSNFHLKVHLKVPGATQASSLPDVSLVVDLSSHVGNLAALQRVDVLEYPDTFRTVYDTPDVMYVGDSCELYRDRALSDQVKDISYLIANRAYYFYHVTSNAQATKVAVTGGGTLNPDGNLTQVIWTSPATTIITSGGSTFAGGTIPVVADLSLALPDKKTKENVKWVGDKDGSSSLVYRFAFSTHKPTDLQFNGLNKRLDLSAMHVLSAGAKRPVHVKEIDASTVDVSFTVGVNAQTDVSLDDLFVTSKLSTLYSGMGDVSGAPLPAVKYPKEHVYSIPTGISYEPVADKWTGIVTSSGDSPQTVINHLYDGDYMKKGTEKHRTAFDVNQPTNYVEMSLNQVLPSGVSAEWFTDASFVQYSTWNGAGGKDAVPEASWVSVSFDRGEMLTGSDNQTVKFSICGECLDSHNLYLRPHVVLYDSLSSDNKSFVTRDVSFTVDLSDKLMKQPVFKEVLVLDHKDMTYKEPKNVNYVVNVHNLQVKQIPKDVQNPHVQTRVTNSDWNDLFDMSCVARFSFEDKGTGAHNGLHTHYECDGSMSYRNPNTLKTYVEHTAAVGKKDISYVDICGQFVENVYTMNGGANADVSLADVSFSLKLRRKNALHEQRVDASDIMHTITLDASQIWQIPNDISWVHAFTTVGGNPSLMTRGQDKTTVTGKFTNVHNDNDNPAADLSYHTQRITIDFSNGYFPTNKLSDYIKDISYSVNNGAPDTGFNLNQQYFIGFSDDTIYAADGDKRLRRIGFDMSYSAIGFRQMWLQIRLKGPDGKLYYIIKVIDNHIDALAPNQEFTIYPVKPTESSFIAKDIDGQPPPRTIGLDRNPLFFEDERTDNSSLAEIETTHHGYFNTLQDMSFAFVTKDGKKFDTSFPITLKYDVSYLKYSEYKSDAADGTGYIAKRQIDAATFTHLSDTSFNSFLSWRDISKGLLTHITYYANLKYNVDPPPGSGSWNVVDISAVFQSDNMIQYIPPKGTEKRTRDGLLNVDVCSNIDLIPNGASVTPILLNSSYSGKQVSLMAPGELSMFLDTNISYDMLPADVGSATSPGHVSTKATIQRVVKAIDICYGSVRDHKGITTPPPNVGGKPNDVSCVQGTYSYFDGERSNTRSGNNATNNILFNFDASADAAALGKYQPHMKPTSDLSINLTFYTDLTHSETSTITWVVPKDNIDWLNPPTKHEKVETKRLAGNSGIRNKANTKDMSWTNVYDTSMTVVLDQKFHKFFRYRYAGDTSGMIIDASLVWAVDTTGNNKRDLSPQEVPIKTRLVTERDQSYVQLDISWQDFSKGVPVEGDVSSMFFTMRVHNRREANDLSYNDISFGISRERIEYYVAPKDGSMSDVSCLLAPSHVPLTDFSMTTLYKKDQSLNLVFDISAFGDLYLSTSSPTWQPRLEDVVSSISYDWLHDGTYKEIYNHGPLRTDCSFLPRSLHGHVHDVLQVPIQNEDVSNEHNIRAIRATDASAMHIRVALFTDRAKTPALVRCISMGIGGNEISHNQFEPPTEYVETSTKAAWANDAPASIKYFTDSSLSLWGNHDISLLLHYNEKFQSDNSSAVIMDLSYIHDFCGNNITTSNVSLASTIDISSTKKEYLTVRLSKEDLSAGIPIDYEYKFPNRKPKDISFVTRVYRDGPKNESLATDVTFAVNEKDISYYKPPVIFNEFRDPVLKTIDISCLDSQDRSVGAGKKLCTLVDTSVNLTISADYLNTLYNQNWNTFGFPSQNADDWIYDISLVYGNPSVYAPAGVIHKPFEIHRTTDGSNLIVKCGMKDTLKLTSLSRTYFEVHMYNDKSKSKDRTHSAKTLMLHNSDISQVSEPTKFVSIVDTYNDSPTDMSLTIVKPGVDPTINITFKFDAPVSDIATYDISTVSRLVYRYKDKGGIWSPLWYSDGLTQTVNGHKNKLSQCEPSMNDADAYRFDISMDPRPVLWSVDFRGDKGTHDILDFSMHIFKKDGSSKDISDGNVLFYNTQVKHFFVNPDALSNPDISNSVFSSSDEHRVSVIRDTSINITPSSEHYYGTKTYHCPFYFDDISHHVRDVSWTYTYNVGGAGNLSVAYNYDLSANVMTKVRESAPPETETGYSWWTKGRVKRFTEDVTFDGKDASGLQLGLFGVEDDLSKGTPVSFKVEMSIYNDLSYTRGGRSATTVTKTIDDKKKIEHYVYPKSFTISSELVDGTKFRPEHKFSNLLDVSVNLDLSFGAEYADGDVDFTKHPKRARADFSYSVIKDLSFQWNKGPYIQASDISVVSMKRVQFRVLQNDISTYPVEGISFNVLFWKDVAKTSSYVADVSNHVIASEISSVVLPQRILKFEALDHNSSDVTYTDCSLSLLDQFKTSGYKHLAKCRVTLDKPLTDEKQVKFQLTSSRSVLYGISRETANLKFGASATDASWVGQRKANPPSSAGPNSGSLSLTAGQMYSFGVSMEDISVNRAGPDGGAVIDFSVNTQHLLMGLNESALGYPADMSAVQFMLAFDSKSVHHPGHITDEDLSYTAPFVLKYRDISMYDGKALVESKMVGDANAGWQPKCSRWGGATLDSSFDVMQDVSLTVKIPTNAGITQYAFKTKKKGASGWSSEYLDISMVVQDISINYPNPASAAAPFPRLITNEELEGRIYSNDMLEFRVKGYTTEISGNTDISFIFNFKTDVCGNGVFSKKEKSTVDVSYVMPGKGVKKFPGVERVDYDATYLYRNSGGGIKLAGTANTRTRATMREDFSLNILLHYPVDVCDGNINLKTGGSIIQGGTFREISNHVFVHDISYAWNSKLKAADISWNKVPYEHIRLVSTDGVKRVDGGVDVSLQIRIPKPDAEEYPYAFGDLSINMYVRKSLNVPTGQWKSDSVHLTPMTFVVEQRDICANPFEVDFSPRTISGDAATSRILGYNLDGKYAEYIKVKFPDALAITGLSYETLADGRGIMRSDQTVGTRNFDISTSAKTHGVEWGEAWKETNMPLIKRIVYQGRGGQHSDPFVSFRGNGNPNDISLGVIGDNDRTITTGGWTNKINREIICINDTSYSVGTTPFPVTFGAEQQILKVSPWLDLKQGLETGRSEMQMFLSFTGSHGLDLSDIVFGKRLGVASNYATQVGRMYQLKLGEEPFTAESLAKERRVTKPFYTGFPKPSMELTKRANVNWHTDTFDVCSNAWFTFDLSSDLSLSIPNMNIYRQGDTTFFMVDVSGPHVGSSISKDVIVMYPSALSDVQRAELKVLQPNLIKSRAGGALREMSFNIYTIDEDVSHQTRRVSLWQDASAVRPHVLDQSYGLDNFRAYNLYDTSYQRTHYLVDISFEMHPFVAAEAYKMGAPDTGLLTYSVPGT